jgi:transposase
LPERIVVISDLFECKSSEERVGVQEAELNGDVDSENNHGGSSRDMYYIGLDVHKKTISYCVKDVSGGIQQQGTIPATRTNLDGWMKTLPRPWMAAMEATIFTGWIYDHLLPHAAQVKVAHPLMLRAIAASKKKNDRIDAGKIADCLRCDFLPECHMVSTQIRDRRRTLRYRHLLVRQMVQMKNRVSGLLLETGVTHNKQRLHKVKYSENCSPRTRKWRKASGHCSSSAANLSNDSKRLIMLWSVRWNEIRY